MIPLLLSFPTYRLAFSQVSENSLLCLSAFRFVGKKQGHLHLFLPTQLHLGCEWQNAGAAKFSEKSCHRRHLPRGLGGRPRTSPTQLAPTTFSPARQSSRGEAEPATFRKTERHLLPLRALLSERQKAISRTHWIRLKSG